MTEPFVKLFLLFYFSSSQAIFVSYSVFLEYQLKKSVICKEGAPLTPPEYTHIPGFISGMERAILKSFF